MGLFSKKKEKSELTRIRKYYKIDGNFYILEVYDMMTDSDRNLSTTDMLNKFGFDVAKYDILSNKFDWFGYPFNSLDELVHTLDLSNIQEIDEEDFDSYIESFIADVRKEFDEFKLNGMLFSSKTYNSKQYGQCFRSIVRPISKLIDSNQKGVSKMILDVEVLDGNTSIAKREFIPFYEFKNGYRPGCELEVVDSIYGSSSNDIIEHYFGYYMSDKDLLPF